MHVGTAGAGEAQGTGYTPLLVAGMHQYMSY
jgi:hypothetical protein